MFQPQPTPFAAFTSPYGFHVAGVGADEYAAAAASAYGPSPATGVSCAPPAPAAGGAGQGLLAQGHHPPSGRRQPHAAHASPAGSNRSTTTCTSLASSSPSASSCSSTTTTSSSDFHNSLPHQSNLFPLRSQQPPPQTILHNQYHPNTRRPGHSPVSTSLAMDAHQQDSDLAQQEAAARAYEPQLNGPLVGDKTSSHAITAEYAKADPTYVTKTIALSSTYSHYRPVQGDGNCGWRAIAFGYFEQLIRSRDRDHVQNELNRLIGLNDYIENVGGQTRWMFEDMASASIDLLQEILLSFDGGQDSLQLLEAKINDTGVSAAIVYHFRLLAASWLKGHFEEFQPYLDMDINSYIDGTVLPVNIEIDHICVKVLVDILLKDANMVLEIAYLDRSEGAEVNVHRMPEEANGRDRRSLGPIIHLLYRPGHYDILYCDSVLPPQSIPIAPSNIQVNRATSFSQHEPFHSTGPPQGYGTMDINVLAMIPGLDPGMSIMSPQTTTSPPLSIPYGTPSPVSWATPPPFLDSMAEPAVVSMQTDLGASQPSHIAKVHPLRFSKYNFPGLPEMTENSQNEESDQPHFTTSLFKNSHFNPAHFGNKHFQPELYLPESDETSPKGGRLAQRKKSS